MKLELTHDIIAEKVWQRMPEADKQLRMIERSLEQRLQDYQQGRGSLLGKKELNAWEAYLDRLKLNTEEKNFVYASRKAIVDEEEREKRLLKIENERLREEKVRQRKLRVAIVIIAGVIGALSYYSFTQSRELIQSYSELWTMQARNISRNGEYRTAFLLAQKAVDQFKGNAEARDFLEKELKYYLSKHRLKSPLHYESSPDGRFLFALTGGENDRKYVLLDLKKDTLYHDLFKDYTQTFQLPDQAFLFGPDSLALGAIMVGSSDNMDRAFLDLWELDRKEKIKDSIVIFKDDLSLLEPFRYSFRFTPEGYFLRYLKDDKNKGILELWDIRRDSLLHQFRQPLLTELQGDGFFRYVPSGYLAVVTDQGRYQPEPRLEVWDLKQGKAFPPVNLPVRQENKEKYAYDYLFSEGRHLAVLAHSRRKGNAKLEVRDLGSDKLDILFTLDSLAYAFEAYDGRGKREESDFENAFSFYKTNYLLALSWAKTLDSVRLTAVDLQDSTFSRRIIPVPRTIRDSFPLENPQPFSVSRPEITPEIKMVNYYLPFFQMGEDHLLAIEQKMEAPGFQKVELWDLQSGGKIHAYSPSLSASRSSFFINKYAFFAPGRIALFNERSNENRTIVTTLHVFDYKKGEERLSIEDKGFVLRNQEKEFRSIPLVSMLGSNHILLHYAPPELGRSTRYSYRVFDQTGQAPKEVKRILSERFKPLLDGSHLITRKDSSTLMGEIDTLQVHHLESWQTTPRRLLLFPEEVKTIEVLKGGNVLFANSHELRIVNPALKNDSIISVFSEKWQFTEEEKARFGLN